MSPNHQRSDLTLSFPWLVFIYWLSCKCVKAQSVPPSKIRFMIIKPVVCKWLSSSHGGVLLSFLFLTLSVSFCLHFFLSILLSFSLLLPQIDPCPQPLSPPLLYSGKFRGTSGQGRGRFPTALPKGDRKKAPPV